VIDLAEVIDDRSARGIAGALGRMITSGHLAVGSRLPTVRQLALALGVSPTTVSEAWQTLAAVGAIDARGRQGTFVREPIGVATARRYRRVSEGPGHFALDLSTGTPDPALLPDLAPAVARIGRQSLTASYVDHPVLPPLDEHLRAVWPFPAEDLSVVDGAMDALDRVTAVVVRFGDRVVVEHPTFPPLLDLLDLVGAEVTSVDVDVEGVVPAQLAEALTLGPTAGFGQPRAHNPTGATMTAARAEQLAALLRGSAAIVVEDDHSGDVGGAELFSLGSWLPERTVHIRSFSKSHGPDLRLAAIGGPGSIVSAVADRRLLGPGWSCRLLQGVLLDLLTDPGAVAQVAGARRAYAERRATLLARLHDRGVSATAADGINLWMAVDDQQIAMVALAARGIAVAPGAPFCVTPLGADHVRVTAGLVAGNFDHLADALASAAILDSRGSGARVRPHPRGWR
jgi:DNA-binding transcriptional MocR family regulator